MPQTQQPIPAPKSGQAAQKAINQALKNNREAVVRAIAKQGAQNHAGSLRYLRDK